MKDKLVLIGLDPGTRQTGWAVLHGEQLQAHGTLIPKRTLHGIDRQLWLLSKLQDIVREWQPALLAYEEFTWRSYDDEAERYVNGRPDMERLIGGIQSLALAPPFPVVMGLLPSRWGQQLTGQRSHTKQQVAFCVNARLHTEFKGDYYDNHACDAVGLALVAGDMLRQQHTVGTESHVGGGTYVRPQPRVLVERRYETGEK